MVYDTELIEMEIEHAEKRMKILEEQLDDLHQHLHVLKDIRRRHTHTDEWQCEECGDMHSGQPEQRKVVPGYDGPIKLLFCEVCVDE